MSAEERFNRDVAKRVREARESLDLSQKQAGEKLGMSEVGYGHYERGSRQPTVWQLFQLSRILGRPVEWFLGLDTGLSDDEGQLLASYRAAAADDVRAMILRAVRSMVQGGE